MLFLMILCLRYHKLVGFGIVHNANGFKKIIDGSSIDKMLLSSLKFASSLSRSEACLGSFQSQKSRGH